MNKDIDHGDYRIAVVKTEGEPHQFQAQVYREDGRHFSFNDTAEITPEAGRRHLTSVKATAFFDTETEAIDAGRLLAETCKIED